MVIFHSYVSLPEGKLDVWPKNHVSPVDGLLNPSIDGLNVRLMVSMTSDFGENEASSAVPPFQNGHFTSK
jgi:hypothetical protein